MNQPKYNKRKFKTSSLMIIASIILVMISIYILVNNKNQDEMIKEGLTYLMDGEGYAVNREAMIHLMTGSDSENELILEFPAGCGVYHFGDRYYIKNKDNINIMISKDFPIFLNHGAYLYLFHPEFSMITAAYTTIPGQEGRLINDGKVFNQEGKLELSEDILLLKLPNEYHITTKKLQIKTQDTIDTIDMNSVVLFQEDTISWCNLVTQPFKNKRLDLNDPMTMVEFGGNWYTYDVFLDKLQSNTEAKASHLLDEYEVEHDLYQYYMGNRYEYSGDKHFYRTKKGYYMEFNQSYLPLVSAPLYYTEEQKILIPCDYVLIQPKLFQMNKLPAMSEIIMEEISTGEITTEGIATEGIATEEVKAEKVLTDEILTQEKFTNEAVVYTFYGKKLNTFLDLILFDGMDTYVFFHESELTFGEESLRITPFSTITVGKDLIEIYDYDTKEYLEYNIDGQRDVIVTLNDRPIYNLSKDLIYRPDGQEQILFTNPQILTEVN